MAPEEAAFAIQNANIKHTPSICMHARTRCALTSCAERWVGSPGVLKQLLRGPRAALAHPHTPPLRHTQRAAADRCTTANRVRITARPLPLHRQMPRRHPCRCRCGRDSRGHGSWRRQRTAGRPYRKRLTQQSWRRAQHAQAGPADNRLRRRTRGHCCPL